MVKERHHRGIMMLCLNFSGCYLTPPLGNREEIGTIFHIWSDAEIVAPIFGAHLEIVLSAQIFCAAGSEMRVKHPHLRIQSSFVATRVFKELRSTTNCCTMWPCVPQLSVSHDMHYIIWTDVDVNCNWTRYNQEVVRVVFSGLCCVFWPIAGRVLWGGRGAVGTTLWIFIVSLKNFLGVVEVPAGRSSLLVKSSFHVCVLLRSQMVGLKDRDLYPNLFYRFDSILSGKTIAIESVVFLMAPCHSVFCFLLLCSAQHRCEPSHMKLDLRP